MIVTPAVDLRDGRCVQLVGGSYDNQPISLDDPVAVALQWRDQGFETLHIVDLDAATGKGSNAKTVERIVEATSARVQVGGGMRSEEQIVRILELGATHAVVGTRALEEPDWLSIVAEKYPGNLIVAADVRDRKLLTRGWKGSVETTLEEQFETLNSLPLAAVLVTAVHREGLMQGPDVSLIEELVRLSVFPVQASGGVTTSSDIRSLALAGATSAIVGMALYTGALSVAEIKEALS
jgi:phosphoribosylformimino-5-aminoimidazole carboxamide ribotide isomerase